MADADNIEAKIVSIDAKTTNVVTNTGTTSQNVIALTSEVAAVNAELGTLSTEVVGLSGKVSALTTQVVSGFQGVGVRLDHLADLEVAEISYLSANIEQNKTILCWLEKIANLLCSQLRVQEAIQGTVSDLASTVADLGAILALVHAREALELQARQALEDRLEKCCPEPMPVPMPCFQRCEDPKYELVEVEDRPKPDGSDTNPNISASNTNKKGAKP